MTRNGALKLLRSGRDGVAEWNRLRTGGESIPDLSNADLPGVTLSRANLDKLNLRSANLNGAKLSLASLENASLEAAQLAEADLRRANLGGTNLRGANLRASRLRGAYAADADLTDADLSHADLWGTDLRETKLAGAILNGASFGMTGVACDLREALGLEETVHRERSFVDVNSILRFTGDLPERFLRGCGLRDEEIAYFRSVVRRPIQFYSCVISYSTADEAFASRLHDDFQAAGVRCWKWDHDARTGRSIWGEIDQAIRDHDKVVLIASESSLISPAVNREIERAIQEEDRRLKDKNAGKFDGDIDVLFPVRVDDYVFDGWQHERKADVVKKVIADARNWDKDPAVYAKVRDKLIKDLKAA